MEDIIESFENWWLNELDTYHQKGFWKKVRFDEARGTNIKDISIIISKVKELLRTYEGLPFRKINGYNEIITKRIDFSDDNVFLKDLNFVLRPYDNFTNIKFKGSYLFSEARYDHETDTLIDNTIILYGGDDDKFIIKDSDLNTTLWHELQHAYRQYCLMKENYDKSVYCNNKNEDYELSYGMASELPKYFGSNGLKVRQMIYMSDKNEIDSHMQEMIPYIERNKQINFSNHKLYLKDNPSYKFLLTFKEALEDCDYYSTNVNGINNMGIILKTLYSNIPKYEKLNWSIGHYFKIFHSRMKKMYIYAEQQFYKILYYTLENFGRRNIKETALRTTIHENVNYGNKNEIERSRKEMTKKHHIKIIDKF